MINFSVGPVLMDEATRAIGSEEIPYFRTDAFSQIMFDNERMMKQLTSADEKTRLITLTGSGTLAMDATILNCFTKKDKLLIINGGSFGARFCEIADCYSIPFETIDLQFGEELTVEHFQNIEFSDFTGLVVNADETSSGVLYDIEMLGNICKEHNLFFVVDAISSFLADPINISSARIDILIAGSQKALALPPGVSLILCSEKAQDRINNNLNPTYYQNLKRALKDGERGQTPFTPAVGIILQLHEKLLRLSQKGIEQQIQKTQELATYFRKKVSQYNFEFVTTSPSNAVTALRVPEGVSAKRIFQELEHRFGIWICPNGGELSDKVFRVGHIGNLQKTDYDTLFNALDQLKKEGIIR
ncbi:TPA: alanine--glyoxylate aminotransferase family protein [Streptococcus suis]|uniref:Aspartate aminotransferase n=1 Tax=Streptococcus suis TaxID=1307 RepID=A0A0A7M6K4_STRSU|nr:MULTISPECIES: aminotransferase class V-fold PLP-dependent enzyme [Streptococcus]AIZ73046.1 Cps31N [Streptococcus suis]AWX95202.1 aspartate aminotransferase [Streptococcus suis]AWX97151.1 aspartate aminotransferase [Streptococcus suis]MBM7136542.1 alanine--glyoxylate aminotransferase family protein [Streptococcus suis]MBM7137747.1 alanine--glyoxylate aminotransferase family protein [Streptococcus suis]